MQTVWLRHRDLTSLEEGSFRIMVFGKMRLYTLAGLAGIMGLLSGCSGYDGNFKVKQLAWAGQPGNRTLAVLLSGHDNLHPQLSCRVADVDVMLMPDAPYFRDYLRIDMAQAGFREKIGNSKALALVRHAARNDACQLVFANLPAGSWLLATRPHFYVNDEAAAQQGKPSQHDVAPAMFMWNRITVDADNDVTAVHVEKDLSRIVRKKHQYVRKHTHKKSKKRIREFHGEGSPDTQQDSWIMTPAEKQALGIPGMTLTPTAVAPSGQ